MKTYIKPYTYCTLLTEEAHILAGSGAPQYPNQAQPNGTGVNIPGYSHESTTTTGDRYGNVEDMAKHCNPWTSWDDFDL